MTAKKTAAFKLIERHLDQLTDRELQEVAAMATGLLQAREDEREAEEREERLSVTVTTKGRPAGRGHIEYKKINGCGPYKYLRYWVGKTLRSKYLGKAK